MRQVYADIGRRSLRAADIRAGDPVKPMEVELTHTIIAATAIATAISCRCITTRTTRSRVSAPDVFLNILSDQRFRARFLTTWAGGGW